jgi:hypothetical protein
VSLQVLVQFLGPLQGLLGEEVDEAVRELLGNGGALAERQSDLNRRQGTVRQSGQQGRGIVLEVGDLELAGREQATVGEDG